MNKTWGRLQNIVFIAMLAISFSAIANAQVRPAMTQTSTDKVDAFVKHSGFEFTATGADSWAIKRPSGMILIAAGTDFLVVGMVVAKKADFRVTAESMSDMLKLAHNDLDYLKVGIDDDGDLFVRAESRVRLMDQAEFNDIVAGVLKGYEKASAKIAPYLVK